MTNAYQVSIAARQLLEGYAAAMQPLCRREGLAAFRRCLEGFRRNLSQMTQEDAQ